MRARASAVAFVLAALLSFGIAYAAASAQSAGSLYRAGHYEEAIAAGVAEGDGKGLTAAAEAAFVIATLKDVPCTECLSLAEDLARKAIAADPDNPRADIALVATLAYQSRRIGVFASQRAHYPAETEAALKKAQAFAPDDPWTLAALGGWHIEVVRAAGSMLARVLYGADFQTGHAYFGRAMAADPDNPMIAYHFALALTSYDVEAKRSEIAALLEASTHGKPDDAYGEVVRDRAVHLLDLLTHAKNTEYLALARRYLGFPESAPDPEPPPQRPPRITGSPR